MMRVFVLTLALAATACSTPERRAGQDQAQAEAMAGYHGAWQHGSW